MAVVCLGMLVACGGDDPAPADSTADTTVDTTDTSADVPLDDVSDDVPGEDADAGAPDADDAGEDTADAGEDTADVGVDTVDDVGLDVVDVSNDAADAGVDAVDTGDDAADALDAGPDAVDASPDASDVGADTIDASPDAFDAGPDAADASPDTDLPGDGATLLPFDPADISEGGDVFSLGIQAGAMRSNSVLLWSWRSTDDDIVLRVWRDSETPGEVWMVIDDLVAVNRDGYIRAIADGLLPGTWYRYAFFTVDDDGTLLQRSPVGRVRTALAPGSREPIRVAATSCTNSSFQPWEALEAMAGQEYDLFLHMGDQSYNDGAETLREFRDAWRQTLTDPGYRALHSRSGWYGTWDDHEVDDNWDPETFDATARDNAFQAYFETLAVERQDSGALWHSYSWGDTAEFFVLDARSERRPSTRGGEDIYISPEQMAWLQDGLRNSTAHFKVILNSVPITDMPPLYIAEGDRWEGYATQRRALLDMISSESVTNVWFLSGDFHIGFVARVDGNDDPLFEIAAGPGGNTNPAASTLGLLFGLAGRGDQLLYNTGSFQTEMQTFITFDPERDAVRVEFLDADGDVQYDEWLQQDRP